MPVRGTTRWQHAVVSKKVINHDRGGTFVMCGWADCEKPGYENNKVVTHLGVERGERTMTYVFCTDRHKQYWLNQQGSNNCLPPGYRLSIL